MSVRGFNHVDTWVFDLDNTLYPHDLNLWQQIDDRIRAFVSEYLKVTKDDAFRVQKDYYKRYGTTMRGLMAEHGMKPDDFLDFVHAIDHSPLTPNPALGAALESLPGRKLILTNGTRKHADAVMRRLEIHQHFEDVFDIIAAELEPKPSPQTYDRFLKLHDIDAARVELLLTELRLPAMKTMWTRFAEQSDKEGWPAARFLAALAELLMKAPPLLMPVPLSVSASAVPSVKPLRSSAAPAVTLVPAAVVPNGVLVAPPAAPNFRVPALIVVRPV